MNSKDEVSILQKVIELIVLLQDGETSLHVASAKGHKEIVSILIENGADMNCQANVSISYIH